MLLHQSFFSGEHVHLSTTYSPLYQHIAHVTSLPHQSSLGGKHVRFSAYTLQYQHMTQASLLLHRLFLSGVRFHSSTYGPWHQHKIQVTLSSHRLYPSGKRVHLSIYIFWYQRAIQATTLRYQPLVSMAGRVISKSIPHSISIVDSEIRPQLR